MFLTIKCADSLNPLRDCFVPIALIRSNSMNVCIKNIKQIVFMCFLGLGGLIVIVF